MTKEMSFESISSGGGGGVGKGSMSDSDSDNQVITLDSDSDSDSEYNSEQIFNLQLDTAIIGYGHLLSEKTKKYAKILACVAVLYGDITSVVRNAWGDELKELLQDIEDPRKDDVVKQAKVGGMSFRNSLGSTIVVMNRVSFLHSVKEELLEEGVEYAHLIDYVLGIINIKKWGNIIEHFIKIELD